MRRVLFAVAVLGILGAAGCTKVSVDRDKVTQALDRTESRARDFLYADKAGDATTVVTGSVEDDFRFSLAGTRDGAPLASEVVYDDARALQVNDPALIQAMTRSAASSALPVPGGLIPSPSPAASPSAGASPSPGAATAGASVVPPALLAGQWVLDKTGAAALRSVATQEQVTGKDPLHDAITSLEYVRRAVGEAAGVLRFNPESQSYRPKLDPFPRPGQGTLRYDLVPPILTPKQSNEGGLSRALPNTAFFRLMAIYVRDGTVVEVRERINIATRLTDPQSNLEARIGDFIKVSSGESIEAQATALGAVLNVKLPQGGQPPIRQRDLDLKFTSLGRSQTVALPSGTTDGDLTAVGGQGQVLFERR
ncbi:MAG: hypothetical protein ACYDGR_01215 [Candidatus Dormibacteria bacterium]